MNEAKLQVALDFVDLDRAMHVARQAMEAGADYLELGTPLIKSEGLDAVRKMRQAFGEATLIADMKTMDAGKIETEAAGKAGANVITVLGAAQEGTIRQCVEAGRHYNVQVAVDLLGVSDPLALARRCEQLGVSWLDVHCAIDAQMEGEDPLELLRALRGQTSLTLAVAGGINSETAAGAVEAGADVVIVGGAITKAVDPREATENILQALRSGKPVASDLFKRAGADNLRQALSGVRTSNISDGAHRQPCLAGLKGLQRGAAICGPAVTVQTVPGDWSKPVQAIDQAAEGDVIVIDASGAPPAVWGELASESAKNKGIAGVVCFGAIRDSAEIRQLGFPVWSTYVTSHAGDPHGMGRINRTIQVAGQSVSPGDWIVADDDGVMVLPKARAVELANRAADVLEAENRIRQEIRQGGRTLAQVVHLKRWEQEGGGNVIG